MLIGSGNVFMKDNINRWPYNDYVSSEIYKNRKDWPKISIVTPSYNQGQYIEETILSILNQNYPNLEYIIIDGGSTDNTIEVIKKYEDRINYWVSEKDNGQADAINKGIEKCTGEIFNWINSDDYLAENALHHVANNFNLNEFDLLAATVSNFEEGDKNRYRTIQNINLSLHNVLAINKEKPYLWHQPGVFFSLTKLKNILPFNISLRYTFDFELTLKYLYHFPKVKYIDNTLVYFRLHNNSKSVAEQDYFENEFFKSYQYFFEYLPNKSKIRKAALRKVESIKWHSELDKITQSTSSNLQLLGYIIKNIIIKPKYRTTRYSLGRLKITLKKLIKLG